MKLVSDMWFGRSNDGAALAKIIAEFGREMNVRPWLANQGQEKNPKAKSRDSKPDLKAESASVRITGIALVVFGFNTRYVSLKVMSRLREMPILERTSIVDKT